MIERARPWLPVMPGGYCRFGAQSLDEGVRGTNDPTETDPEVGGVGGDAVGEHAPREERGHQHLHVDAASAQGVRHGLGPSSRT